MRLTERQTLPHQIVGQVGGGGKISVLGRGHTFGIEPCVLQQCIHDGKRNMRRIQCVEKAFFIFLHIFVVGQRQALHQRQKCGQVTEDPPSLAAHQLGDIRVLLLRHDGAARGHVVTHRRPAELV